MRTAITAHAAEFFANRQEDLNSILGKHFAGEPGEVDAEDKRVMAARFKEGGDYMSVWQVGDRTIWVMTDGLTTACEACWTGQGKCPGGGHYDGVPPGTHFLDVEPRAITTTVLFPEDY